MATTPNLGFTVVDSSPEKAHDLIPQLRDFQFEVDDAVHLTAGGIVNVMGQPGITGVTDDNAALQAIFDANPNATILFENADFISDGSIILTDDTPRNFQGQILFRNATLTFTNDGSATDDDIDMQRGFASYPKVNGSGGDSTGLGDGCKTIDAHLIGPAHGASFYSANSSTASWIGGKYEGNRYGLVLETSIGAKVDRITFEDNINAGLFFAFLNDTARVWYNATPANDYWNDSYTVTNCKFTPTGHNIAGILDHGSNSQSIRTIDDSNIFVNCKHGYLARKADPTITNNWFEDVDYPIRLLTTNASLAGEVNITGITAAEPDGTYSRVNFGDGNSVTCDIKGNMFTRAINDMNLQGVSSGTGFIGQNRSTGLTGFHLILTESGGLIVDSGDTIAAGTYKSVVYPATYLKIADILVVPTLTGPVTINGLTTIQGAAGGLLLKPQDGSGSDFSFYNPTGDDLRINVSAVGDAVIIKPSGDMLKLTTATAGLTKSILENSATTGIVTATSLQLNAYNGTGVVSQGALLATANSWAFGTYVANQLNLVALQAGGLGLRSTTAPIIFYQGNASADFSPEVMKFQSGVFDVTGNVRISGLTAGGVPIISTAGLLTYNANLTFSGSTLTGTNLVGSTSITTPLLTTASGNLTITPASGSVLISGSTSSLFLKDTSTGFQASSSTVINPVASNSIRSTAYTSGLIGWNISAAGDAEFNNVDVRGAIHAGVFVYNALLATAGTQGVFKSAAKLKTDVVVPAGPTYGTTTVNIDVVDQDGLTHAASQLFAVNDILRLKDGLVGDTWFKVSSASDQTTFWRYVAIIMAGSNNKTYRAGLGVADYGVSGAGFIIQTADQTNAPYLQMATHAATFSSLDASGSLIVTPQLRLGNLNGSYGYSSDIYGLGTGQYGTASKEWLTVDQANGIRMGNNVTTSAQWAVNGDITIGEVGASKDNVFITAGAISIRNNTTARIHMTAAGVMTLNDSAGVAKITLDAAAGMTLDGKMQMLGANSAISMGLIPPLSSSIGTGVWEDRNGIWGISGVSQVETTTVVGTVTGTGNAAVTVTAFSMAGSPYVLNVAVVNTDSDATVAGKVRTALSADAIVTAFFTVSGSGANVVLTDIHGRANDATMNLRITNGTCTGLTLADSVNTTAGSNTTQVKLDAATGQIVAGAGAVTIDAAGVTGGGGNVVLDVNGLQVVSAASFSAARSYNHVASIGGTVLSSYFVENDTADVTTNLIANLIASKDTFIEISAFAPTGKESNISLSTYVNSVLKAAISIDGTLARIDVIGNLAVSAGSHILLNGTSPFTFTSGGAFYSSTAAVYMGSAGDFHLCANAYDPASWKFQAGGIVASDTYMFAGDLVYRTSPSGSAGGAITWTERTRATIAGNFKIAGSASRGTTEGTNQLVLFNGTAPVGTLTNGVSLYSTAGELRVMDSGGTATLLSAHASDAPEWMYDDDPTPPNISRETNCFSGVVRFINLTRTARLQQLVFDGQPMPSDPNKRKVIHEETFAEYNERLNLAPDDPRFLVVADWEQDQESHHQRREDERRKWRERSSVRLTGQPEPLPYQKRARPAWLKKARKNK